MSGRKICISVDSSPLSQDALSWAARHFVREGDEIHLVTVLQPAIKSEVAYGMGQRLPMVEKDCQVDPVTLANAHQLLENCKQELANSGVDAGKITAKPLVSCVGSSSDVGRHIIEYVTEQKCSSVVMGSRGLGTTKRTMLSFLGLGSIAMYMVKHADCNVIVHKVPPAQAASK